MISPALIAGLSGPQQKIMTPEDMANQDLLLSKNVGLQEENQANLPALQAAIEKAVTQEQNLENEKAQAFLPVYKTALARLGQPAQPAPVPPQYSGIPGLQGGEPLVNGQQPTNYDKFKSLIPDANNETIQNENSKANSQFLGLPAQVQNQKATALTGAKNGAISDALNELKTNIQSAGGKPSDINAAILDTETKYPLLASDPDFKEALTNAKLHDPVFNLNTSNVRDMTNLRGISEKNTNPYLTARNFWSQGEKTYDDYLNKGGPANPGAKSYQQGILDKFVGVSLQKSPTEAQIQLTQSWPGFENYLTENKDSNGNFLGYKLKNGVFIPENVLSSMMDVMRDDVKGLADNVKQNNAGVRRMAGSDYNPDKAMIITDDEIDKDLQRIPVKNGTAGITSPQSKSEFDALPSGSLWKDSQGATHKKK